MLSFKYVLTGMLPVSYGASWLGSSLEHFCSEQNIQDLHVLSDRGTPDTACAELDSALIENVSDLHLLQGASLHPTYQKPSYAGACGELS